MSARMRTRTVTKVAAAAVALLLPGLYGAAGMGADSVMDLALESGAITISGTSNAHDWSCQASELTAEFRVRTSAGGSLPTSVDRAVVTVPVARISCGSGAMDANVAKALDSARFPMIAFAMSGYELVRDPDNGDRFTVTADGTLTVAGVTRSVRVAVDGAREGDRIRIAGSRDLLMTDFGVKPPTAMLGMLKTGDRVTVEFDLTTRYLASALE